MKRCIAAINMSLDGYCDHTAMTADEETHQHYTDLLERAGTLIYGRTTYQLMESYWPTLVKSPSGNKDLDEFAAVIDKIPKIVFSRSLKTVNWNQSQLKNEVIKEEIIELKSSQGGDIIVGSPSLILKFMQLGLIDEYQFCVHPVIVGRGLPLFKNINDRIDLKLTKTKLFGCGAIILYYELSRK